MELDDRIARAVEPEAKPAQTPVPVPEETGEPKSAVLLWALGVIILLIAGIVAVRYILPEKGETKITYNNFEFTRVAGLWSTLWERDGQVYEITLRFSPLETENVSIIGSLNETARLQPVYITFNPSQPELKYVALAASELGLNYYRGLGRNISAACIVNETDACLDRPIVSCDDHDKAVIVLNETAPTGIELSGNCITLRGEGTELTRAVDRLLYHFFRIQP